MKITDEAVEAFTQYRRSQVAELRPWQPGDDVSGVSISAEDAKAGSPKSGDMIARNPKNHADQWLVAAAYFADNFEPLAALPHLSQGAVRVKPLEWVDLGDGKAFRAFLPVIGGIRIEPYGACGWWEVLWSMPGQCDKLIPDVFDTADEAKAAAQADYERRVLSALSPAPVGVSEEMLIAAFLRGENWRRRNDVDRYISVPEMVEKAARDYADATLSALASHEPAPTVANAELQQEVETLREGIKEIAEREQSIRDNWARYEESTKARILELETDLEVANDLIRKKDKALRNIRELNLTRPGADGLRWARSDLIEQEIVFALGGQSNE